MTATTCWIGLTIFIAVCLGAGSLGAIATEVDPRNFLSLSDRVVPMKPASIELARAVVA